MPHQTDSDLMGAGLVPKRRADYAAAAVLVLAIVFTAISGFIVPP